MPLLPANNFGRRQAEELVVFDLGTRVTKAIHLSRKGEGLEVHNYALVEVPENIDRHSVHWISSHLRELWQSLETKTRNIVIVIGQGESSIWQVDLPTGTKSETRKILQLNSKALLQEDLQGFVFDSSPLTPLPTSDTGRMTRRVKTLVGAARKDLVHTLLESCRYAGLTLEAISLGKIAPANAFMRMPDDIKKDVVGSPGTELEFAL